MVHGLVKLSIRRMVEWLSCRIVEAMSNGRVVESLNGRVWIVESSNGVVVERSTGQW